MTTVKIPKSDVIIWFRKWSGLELDYQVLNDRYCALKSLKYHSMPLLLPIRYIHVRLKSIDTDYIYLTTELSKNDTLIPMYLFSDTLLRIALSYMDAHQTQDGTLTLKYSDKLNYNYEVDLSNISPKRIYFEGEDVVIEG